MGGCRLLDHDQPLVISQISYTEYGMAIQTNATIHWASMADLHTCTHHRHMIAQSAQLSTPIVMDNGSGFTKLGYAGNSDPQWVIPTLIATRDASKLTGTLGSSSSKKAMLMEDLDFYIGDEALVRHSSKTHILGYPIRHGQIDNWDTMERYWEACMFHYLRCEPEDHPVLLTEPPLNSPDNREATAEIMFESFNVPSLYIAVQALLALAASWSSSKKPSLSGVVVDSGDGVTHAIPVVDGFVITSAIKSIPVAGREITVFLQQMLRDRDPTIPPADLPHIVKYVKENQCYVCPDIVQEFKRYDQEPTKYFQKCDSTTILQNFSGTESPRSYSIELGYERFLAPEIFFSPEMSSADITTPLPDLVDDVIQLCPMDSRRSLYRNIVLSGGSTIFKDFGKRLQRDVKRLADMRVQNSQSMGGQSALEFKTTPIDVNVVSHKKQRYAVYYGGSLLASTEQFHTLAHDKKAYEEYGPSLFRESKVIQMLS